MKIKHKIFAILLAGVCVFNLSLATEPEKEKKEEKYEPNSTTTVTIENKEENKEQDTNNTKTTDKEREEELKRLNNGEKYGLEKITIEELGEETGLDSKTSSEITLPSSVKNAEDEYKRINILKEKNISFDDILKIVNHAEIKSTSPDGETKREFYRLTTKLDNTYYLIKDKNKDGSEKIMLLTMATEADLLSLLSDTKSTSDIIKDYDEEVNLVRNDENLRREKEKERKEEERKKAEEEAKARQIANEGRKEKVLRLAKENIKIIIITAASFTGLILILVLILIIKKRKNRAKSSEELYEAGEEYEEEDINEE